MSGHYKKRLESHIQEILADLLERETKDPRVEGVVITAVELNHDYSVAKVYFMGGDEDAFTGLKKAGSFLRGKVGRFLKMKTAPALRFHEDQSLDQYNMVEDLLDDAGVAPEASETAAADPASPDDEERTPTVRDGE